jgi:hypothetical protein
MLINKRKIVALIIMISMPMAIWAYRYPMVNYYYLWRLKNAKNEQIYHILYHYNLWKLNHTSEGGEIIDATEKIISISPHISKLLVNTYEDVKAPYRSRYAAALALINVDKKMAEELFISFLNNKDSGVLSMAITDIGFLKSAKPYNTILQFKDHPDARVRRAVAFYIGNFNDAKSKATLKYMENDPDKSVSSEAIDQLNQEN